MSSATLDRVLDKFDHKHRAGGGWIVSCPVLTHGKGNGDRNPSLSVGEHDGRILLNCQTGCHIQDIMIALDLDWPDLFDEPLGKDTKVAEWIYQARDGSPYMVVERWQGADGKKKFKQHTPESATLPTNFMPALFALPKVLAAAAAGQEVYIVEGEKACAAGERLGLVTTTGPGGAGKWRDYYGAWLEGCCRVTIVTDNDEVGMHHAAGVAASLRGRKIPVRTVKVATTGGKDDLYDHVLAGYGVEDLVPVKLNQYRPLGISSADLDRADYPAVQYVIPGLMPLGLTLLGGAPKTGKSFTALDIALAVAGGGEALHNQRCPQGSVLYLSLDSDSEWRLQLRQRHLCRQYGIRPPRGIEYHVDFPVGDFAIQAITEWCGDEREEGRRPRLVVVDTIARAEPNLEGGERANAYLSSTSNMARWAKLAEEQELGILALHHTRKQGDEGDWLNAFIGSRGLTGAATNLLMIDAKRGTNRATLHASSRDTGELELEMERESWSWCLLDRLPSVGPELRAVH
jgi:hypothetical protein